jgi:hypothetical protein
MEKFGSNWINSRKASVLKKMDVLEIMYEVVCWIHLAQDRDHWQALVNTVINICIV